MINVNFINISIISNVIIVVISSVVLAVSAVCVLLCREAMEKMVDDGLVRHIGVSNFSVKQVEELLEHARIKPVANQIELHPFLAQRKLVGVCARKVCLP